MVEIRGRFEKISFEVRAKAVVVDGFIRERDQDIPVFAGKDWIVASGSDPEYVLSNADFENTYLLIDAHKGIFKRKPLSVLAMPAPTDGFVDERGVELKVNAYQDWLVWSESGGKKHVLSHDEFIAKYKPIDGLAHELVQQAIESSQSLGMRKI